MSIIKLGILREGKLPKDNRVPLTPEQCKHIMDVYPKLEVYVQSSSHRCFTNQEYRDEGIPVVDEMEDYDIVMGVKEVPIPDLADEKKMLFFSHTIKEQPYNRGLLQEILNRKIQLIDYETLTFDNGSRILGFGRFAGIVGAHNGLMVWGKRSKKFSLKPAYECRDFEELQEHYWDLNLPNIKIAVTGGGRVAKGAIEVLLLAGAKEVSKEEFISKEFDHPVFVNLDTPDLYRHSENKGIELAHFFENPGEYEGLFHEFYPHTDLMINAIYWDPDAPIFFTRQEMNDPSFRIKAIADITCDIEGSIPATHKATTIEDPVYGYDPATQKEVHPYQENCIDIMSVDNLPNELPRDASKEFGESLVDHVIPELMKDNSSIIERASITQNGELTSNFKYLKNYVEG